MDNDSTKLIIKFGILIDKIINLVNSYNGLNVKIANLTNSRINLLDINQHQDKDDIKFYISIFEDTDYFLRKSLSVRKKKLKRDIIKNIKYLNQNVSNQLNIDNIDKELCVNHFISYVNQRNMNNYRWVKNDKCKELKEWLKNFDELINYHNYIYNYLTNMINLNLEFFTSKNDDSQKTDMKPDIVNKSTNTKSISKENVEVQVDTNLLDTNTEDDFNTPISGSEGGSEGGSEDE